MPLFKLCVYVLDIDFYYIKNSVPKFTFLNTTYYKLRKIKCADIYMLLILCYIIMLCYYVILLCYIIRLYYYVVLIYYDIMLC